MTETVIVALTSPQFLGVVVLVAVALGCLAYAHHTSSPPDVEWLKGAADDGTRDTTPNVAVPSRLELAESGPQRSARVVHGVPALVRRGTADPVTRSERPTNVARDARRAGGYPALVAVVPQERLSAVEDSGSDYGRGTCLVFPKERE